MGPTYESGRMKFTEMQDTIRTSQRQRLQVLVDRAEGGKPIAPPVERPIRVPYQSQAAATLMEVTQKKKFNEQDSQINYVKRLHSYSTLIATMENQTQADQIRANSLLVRGPGSVGDKWDRYCALRRTGRSSYVTARN